MPLQKNPELPMNILIVDDKQDNVYLLETIFKAKGFHVATADNGASALEKLKSKPFDLIISDILMPVMDGFQLCREVKGDKTLRHIPFIIYTATYTGPKDEELAAKIGADRFIVKPCEPDVFISHINEVMTSAGKKETPVSAPDEEEVLRLYNERLVRKLEEKMIQLEKEIFERKRSEEQLRSSEEKYRSIMDSMEDAYYEVDLAGNLTFFNQSMSRILGYRHDELMGMNNRSFMDMQNARRVFKSFNQVYRTGKPSRAMDWEVICKDGSVCHINNAVSLIKDANGNPTGFRGVARDVTEQVKAEKEKALLTKQLQQSQKMESIGTLAGGIAHDFNNILAAVLGYTELAIDIAARQQADPKLKDYLKGIFTAGQRAKDLVRQILAFARQSDDELKPVEISPVLKEVLKLIRSSIPASIQISQNIESNAMVMGNPTQIHQIIMNLCTNAAHAMENEHGTLAVGLSDAMLADKDKMPVAGLGPGNYIRITVSDTGTGIAPDIIDSIFEPYFTTKAPGVGTGMGLSMVHGIVESYGGKITVQSTAGQGSVFTVYLPVTQKNTKIHSYGQKTPTGGNERILFVDDEIQIADMSEKMLKALGYTVTTSTSSKSALVMIKTRPSDFDLVITDMSMPGITGDRLAAEINKINPDIPVIVCTGYSKKLSETAGAGTGIRAVLTKPVSRAELAGTIRRVLDEKTH